MWSVKKKKLFERLKNASSFSLAEHPTGVAKKVQPALFLCFVSFVRTKEMKNPLEIIGVGAMGLDLFLKSSTIPKNHSLVFNL